MIYVFISSTGAPLYLRDLGLASFNYENGDTVNLRGGCGGRGGEEGGCVSPAGRPDTLSRRGAAERAGCLGVGDRCLRHSDRHSPLGRGRAAPGMATSRQTASRRTRMDYIYSGGVRAKHAGRCSFLSTSGSSDFFFPSSSMCERAYRVIGLAVQVLVLLH